MNKLYIKVQDANDNWFVARVIDNISDQYRQQEMEAISRGFPGKRIRVVDENGRLIDMLG